MTTTVDTDARDTGFLGQPRVLANLFGVELWERFSFYGMQGILLIYLYYTAEPRAGSASSEVDRDQHRRRLRRAGLPVDHRRRAGSPTGCFGLRAHPVRRCDPW